MVYICVPGNSREACAQETAVFKQEVAFMKVSADYRMLALDALRGK